MKRSTVQHGREACSRPLAVWASETNAGSLNGVWIAAIACCLVGYAVVWSSAPILTTDSYGYLRLAQDIAHLRITAFHQRTAGYPVMLLLTGSAVQPTKLLFYVSLGAHFGTLYMLARLLLWAGVSRRLAAVFVIVGLLPPFVEPAAYVMTETASALTLSATYAALVSALLSPSRRKWLIFAVLMLVCALVRPTFVALGPFLVVVVCGFRLGGAVTAPKWRSVLIPLWSAAALVGLVFGGIAAVNYSRFGMFASTSLGPYQLSTKVMSVIEFLPDKYAVLRDVLIRHRDADLIKPFDDHMAQDYAYPAWPELKQYYGSEVKALQNLEDASVYLILHKPASYLNDCVRLFGQFWMPMEVPLASGGSSALKVLWFFIQLLVSVIFFAQLLLAGGLLSFLLALRFLSGRAVAFVEADRRIIVAYLTGVSVIFYNMLMSCFFGIGAARYRVPTDLMILATSMMGVAVWSKALEKCRCGVTDGLGC